MADKNVYKVYSFALGDTEVCFDPSSAQDSLHDDQKEDIYSGAITRQSVVETRKVPAIRATVYDPTVVTAPQLFGAGETYTGVSLCRRALDETGDAFGTTYKTSTLAQGLLLPMSLKGDGTRRATLEVLALGLYSGSSALTVGSGAVTLPSPVSYYLSGVSLGGSPLLHPSKCDVNWQYQLRYSPNEVEPSEAWTETMDMDGSVTVLDMAGFTAANLAGATAALVLTFTKHGAADTHQLSLGNCHINAVTNGEELTINFRKLNA